MAILGIFGGKGNKKPPQRVVIMPEPALRATQQTRGTRAKVMRGAINDATDTRSKFWNNISSLSWNRKPVKVKKARAAHNRPKRHL